MVDPSNRFLVCAGGSAESPLFTIRRAPHRLTRDDAINLAAWLVALADPMCEEFGQVLKAVLTT